MADYRSPLESPEAFAAFRERVKHQLHTQVQERIAFLDGAAAELQALEGLARRASNVPLVSELANLGQIARHELAALKGTDFLKDPAAAEPGELHENADSAGAQTNGHAYPSFGLATSDARAVALRPAALRPAPPTPEVPPTPTRAVEEIYKDVDALGERLDQFPEGDLGLPGLIRLKAFMCRQRTLQAELAVHGIEHFPLRQIMGIVRRRIDTDYGGNHYLIPLRAELWRVEAWPWQQAAEMYDGMADAFEALDYYDSDGEKIPKSERHELLESIAARQTLLYRHLQTYFPRQNDEHQISLFRELCAIADEEDVYLSSLQERTSDEMLMERSDQLPSLMADIRADKAQRTKRANALEALRALVNSPGFGVDEKDPAHLVAAVAKCRSTGEPASSIAIRRLVANWADLLEASEDKSVQEVVRELAKEADRLAAKLDEDPGEAERALSDAEWAELDAVRAIVRGKKCLFIGGICREESRQRLERELEMAELVWPSTTGTESVYKFEPDIQSTDITVVLVRFMRTGWGQARDLAVRHGKPFVRMPAGYGLRQVTHQFHLQLSGREPAAVTAK